MPNEPDQKERRRSSLGQPVFIVLLVSIVLAGAFLFAMMSLTNDSLFNDIAGAGDDEIGLEENAPPVDRTLLPTPDRNEPLTERVDTETGSGDLPVTQSEGERAPTAPSQSNSAQDTTSPQNQRVE